MPDYGRNFRAPQVDVHRFAMVPRAEIPRSSFRTQTQHKTTIGASLLYPVFLDEVLPGDSFNVSMTAFIRMATPIFPIMDNLRLESFFFFVPCRLVWVHWQNFMGEQNSPSDSISYTVPVTQYFPNTTGPFSIYDYFGLPINNGGGNLMQNINALPFRAYNLIWQEWFRDENLQNAVGTGSTGTLPAGTKFLCMSDDGPDPQNGYALLPAGKIHDYFTACLPWTQKGGNAVTLPLGTSATVKTSPSTLFNPATASPMGIARSDTGGVFVGGNAFTSSGTLAGGIVASTTATTGPSAFGLYPTNLYADLSTATAATINAIRLAFQTQKLLERDARGGTRYTEIVRSHFGVISPDARLMRPEYLGGGRSALSVTPVPQTTGTGAQGTTSPLGTLSGVGTSVLHGAVHGFRYSATEHGYIIGLVCARREQVYQQGIRRLWSRSTRYDFYFPVFAALGEQPVLNREIFADNSANDALVFGYQERWAEYRFHPSITSGYFRSTNATPLDAWHLATKFASVPSLNAAFIQDDTSTVLQRVLAAGTGANNQQLLCDFLFDKKVARPMPVYSVPGMIDHF